MADFSFHRHLFLLPQDTLLPGVLNEVLSNLTLELYII